MSNRRLFVFCALLVLAFTLLGLRAQQLDPPYPTQTKYTPATVGQPVPFVGTP